MILHKCYVIQYGSILDCAIEWMHIVLFWGLVGFSSEYSWIVICNSVWCCNRISFYSCLEVSEHGYARIEVNVCFP